MLRSRLSPSVCALITPVLVAGPMLAQPEAFETSLRPDRMMIGVPLIFEEPGPIQPATLYADGRSIELEMTTTWRPICGSDVTRVTPDTLREIAAGHREIAGPDPVGDPGVPASRGAGLDIVLNLQGGAPTGAAAALAAAEAYIEGQFDDDVQLVINFSFQALQPGILGATGANSAPTAYSSVRSALINEMDSTDTLQEHLPVNALPVRFGTASTVSNVLSIIVNQANFRAALGNAGGIAGSITFSTNVGWDFDPSNGVNGTCFQSVVIHEIGHAMGFTSAVDNRNNTVRMMDLFRFQTTDGAQDYDPDTLEEFMTAPRLVAFNAPNNQHQTDLISVEIPMSDGFPSQASHLQEGRGLMDPAIGPGQTFFPDFLRLNDRLVFDAIGWDYPVPGLPPIAFDDAVAVFGGAESLFPTSQLVANDDPVDGGELVVGSVGEAALGTTSLRGTLVSYTPPTPWFAGTDTFSYTLTDFDGESSATVTITIRETNRCQCEADFVPGVNILDLLAFIEGWLPAQGTTVTPGVQGDFNSSGNVDITDVLEYVDCWLPANAGEDC